MAVFEENLRALEECSPEVAMRVQAVPPHAGYEAVAASDGAPIVLRDGLPLESRRAPAEAARRQVQAVTADAVVVVGLGAGYLPEALMAAGHRVVAIVESRPEAVAAAARARDLRHLFRHAPIILAERLQDPVERICLKAKAATVVAQAGSTGADADLQAVVRAWPQVPAAAPRPRVLVVGPVLRGFLRTARATTRALQQAGADADLLDFTPFSDGWDAFSRMALPAAAIEPLRGAFADLLGSAVVARVKNSPPDLVLAVARAPLGPRPLEELRQRQVRTAFWLVENARAFPGWHHLARCYDTFFTIQSEPFLSELQAAGATRAVHLPAGCDPAWQEQARPVPGAEKRVAADVSFVGRPSLNRCRMFRSVRDLGLRLWGEGWDATDLAASAAEGGRRLTPDEDLEVFAASKINLNLHAADHVDSVDPDADHVNARTFALAACGAFQLVDERQPLAALFSRDEIATFRNAAELRERVRYYLAHPAERSAMAARARARAIAEHTFAHRVEQIMRETLPPAMRAGARLGRKRETLDEAIGALAVQPAMTADEALLRALREVQAAR